MNTIVLATRLCARVYAKPLHESHCLPERTKGGGAPIGAMSWGRVCGRGSGLKALSPLASRRSTAALTEVISLGSTPGRASWNYRVQTGGPSPAPVQRAPRGPVLVPAGRCPKPPECGVTKPARGDRSRCRLRIVSRNALHARDALNVTGMGTNNQGPRLWFKDEKFSLRDYEIHRAVMPGLVPGISLRRAWLCHSDQDGRDKPGHDACWKPCRLTAACRVG